MNTCHFYKACVCVCVRVCVCVCVCVKVCGIITICGKSMCRDQWSEALVERGREILRATHGHECHAFLLIKNYFLTVHLLSAHFFIHFHMKTDHRIILISCPSPFFLSQICIEKITHVQICVEKITHVLIFFISLLSNMLIEKFLSLLFFSNVPSLWRGFF